MKNINLTKTFTLLVFVLLLSASFTMAQEAAVKKVKKETKKASCTTGDVTTAKHVCTDECKTLGCDAVKAKEAKAMMSKHVCTDECKTLGCDAVKAKEAKAMASKHVCTDECKTLGCDVVKAKEAKASLEKHICTDACKNGCTARS